MKTLSAGRQTALDSGQTTDAWFTRIVRTDAVVIGLTNHVADVTIDSVDYLSSAGYQPSAVGSNINLSPGVVDVEGILSVAGIPRADIENGLYDDARLYVFITDYTAPVVDDQKMMTGFWGKTRLEQGRFVAEFSSLLSKLKQKVGRTYKIACDTDLGATRCGVSLTPAEWGASTAYTANTSGDAATGSIVKPTTENNYFYICTTAGTSGGSEPAWSTTIGGTTSDNDVVWTTIRAYTLTGTVETSAANDSFTDSARPEPDDWWAGGVMTFDSGLNSGLSMEIKSYASAGSPLVKTFAFVQPFPFAIAGSDAYTVQAGCLKRLSEDCQTKFDNNINFQGFPYIPTANDAHRVGGQ